MSKNLLTLEKTSKDLLVLEKNVEETLNDCTEQIDALLRERASAFYGDQIHSSEAIKSLFNAERKRDILHICEGLFVIGVVLGCSLAASGLLHLLLG